MPSGQVSDWSDLPESRVVHPPPALAKRPQAPPSLQERTAGENYKRVFEATPADFTGNPVLIDFGVPVTAIRVFAAANDEIFIGLDKPATAATEGSYDEYHPGGGFMVFRINPTQRIYLQTLTGAAPARTVRVWGLGGQFSVNVEG